MGLRVLHIITRLDRGGSAKAVLWLSERLKEEGFEVVVITGPSREPEEDIEAFRERTSIPVHLVPSLVRDVSPLNDLLAFLSLYRLVRKVSPHIVHTHTTKAGVIGRVVGRLCGARAIVHTPHGHIFYGYGGRAMTWFYTFTERVVSRLCDRIVALTPLEKEDYIRLKVAREEMVTVIPVGIDIERYLKVDEKDVDIKRELGIGASTPLVGWMARFEDIKGCFDFLEACSIVVRERQDVRFLMVGDGPLRARIEEWLIEHGMEEMVLLPGYRRDGPRIMAAIDLYVLTSINEGLGMGVVEAMAAGRPVVATRVGGVPAVVSEGVTGILVPPGRPDEIAHAIITILSDPSLAERMGRAGRERAKAYSIEAMARAYIDLYMDLLGHDLRPHHLPPPPS